MIVLPAAISKAYFQHNYSPLQRMIVRLLAGKVAAPFEADVPPYVEANLLTKDGSPILHLVQFCLNHTGGNDAHNNETNPHGMWCG